MAEPITTYSEMNRQIVGLLRLHGEPFSLYAAQRIENLERALRAIKDSPETDYGVYAKFCEETAREGLQDQG